MVIVAAASTMTAFASPPFSATAFAPTIIAAIAFPIARRIFIPVPVVPHKIDAFAAGAVLAAMAFPVPFITGRYSQINRRALYGHRLDCDRLAVYHRRLREVA
jgi:hypothetical protein